MIFIRNTEYWQAESVKLDRIDIGVNDDYTNLKLLKDGRIDWYGKPLNYKLRELNYITPSETVTTVHTNMVKLLYVNCDKFPLHNLNMRLAIHYSIDRAVMHQVSPYDCESAISPLVPQISGLNNPAINDYNPEKAKLHLEKAFQELNCTIKDIPHITIICPAYEFMVVNEITNLINTTLGLKLVLSSYIVG